jgi:hypothetical protein
MTWGIDGLHKISLSPAMPNHSNPSRRSPLKPPAICPNSESLRDRGLHLANVADESEPFVHDLHMLFEVGSVGIRFFALIALEESSLMNGALVTSSRPGISIRNFC